MSKIWKIREGGSKKQWGPSRIKGTIKYPTNTDLVVLNNHMSYVRQHDFFLKGICSGCRTLKLPDLYLVFLTMCWRPCLHEQAMCSSRWKRGAVVIAGPYYLVGVWNTFLWHWREASDLVSSRSNLVYMHCGSPGNQGESRPPCWYRGGLCWKVSSEMDTSARKFSSSVSFECIWNLGSLN